MLLNPLLKIVMLRLKLKIKMLGILHNRLGTARCALGRPQILSSVCSSALIAAVSILIRRTALRANALHKAIGEEHFAMLAIKLRSRALCDRARLLHSLEELGGKLLILGRIRSVVIIELNLKVCKILEVLSMRARDKLLGRDTLLARANHNRRTMRIVCAHIDAVVASQFLVSDPKVSLDILHQMSDVNIAICVRQCARDYYFAFLAHISPFLLTHKIIPQFALIGTIAPKKRFYSIVISR